MKISALVALLGLLAVLISAAGAALPTQLHYNVGDQLDFTVHAALDARGQSADTGSLTGGVTSTLDSVLAIKCTDQKDNGYLFVMNMFNTEVNVGQGNSAPVTVGLGDDNALGDDMYFLQEFDGAISNIWYQDGDSPYFVNIKLGAINSLQTRLVAPGPTQTLLESDPVGVHMSVFVGDGTEALQVNKSFNQQDFQSFADPDVHAGNVVIDGTASTTVHSSGYIMSAHVDQTVVFVNAKPSGSAAASSIPNPVNDDAAGFDMDMASAGSMDVTLTQAALAGSGLRSIASARFSVAHNLAALSTERNMIASNLLDSGRAAAAAAKTGANQDSEDIRSDVQGLLTGVKLNSARLHRVASLMRDDDAAFAAVSAALNSNKNEPVRRAVALLVAAGTPKAQDLLIREAIMRLTSPELRLEAVMACRAVAKPSRSLLTVLLTLARENGNAEIRSAAVLAFGSCIRKADDQQGGVQALLQLTNAMYAAGNNQMLASCVRAMANAGLPADVLAMLPQGVRLSADPTVRRAVEALSGRRVDAARLGDITPMAYNVSWEKDITIGGKLAYLTVDGQLFAGTNFDCNQPTFDYEAVAQASGTVGLFGDTHDAFLAEAIYGKAGGSPLANELLFSVWDETLYQQPLPTISLDCNPHTYQLYHKSPGFTASYTLWITVIPVTFTAAVTLDVNVQWDWSICDTDLSAQVEITPSAGLTLSGSAELDLLIIKGVTELDGSLNSAIVPQAYIHGTECAVGFDVHHTAEPMAVDFHSYYMWRQCKYWIFDCKWGPQNDHVWWNWDAPAVDELLFQQEYKIK